MGLDNGAKSRARRKHADKCASVKGNGMREKLERLWRESAALEAGHGTCILPEREAAVRVATYHRVTEDGLQEMHSERSRVHEPTGETKLVDGKERPVMRSYFVCDAVMPLRRNSTAKGGGMPLRDQQRPPDDELVIIRGRKVPGPAPFRVKWPE